MEDPSLAEALVSLLKSEDTEPGLLKAVTKCVAKLTHGASVLQSHSLMAAVPRLFHLAEHRGEGGQQGGEGQCGEKPVTVLQGECQQGQDAGGRRLRCAGVSAGPASPLRAPGHGSEVTTAVPL